jgi:hypothetical protein
MGIFMRTLQYNSDKKTMTENKIQNNVRQYKIGKFLCNITKYNFWICSGLQIFPFIFLRMNMWDFWAHLFHWASNNPTKKISSLK